MPGLNEEAREDFCQRGALLERPRAEAVLRACRTLGLAETRLAELRAYGELAPEELLRLRRQAWGKAPPKVPEGAHRFARTPESSVP